VAGLGDGVADLWDFKISRRGAVYKSFRRGAGARKRGRIEWIHVAYEEYYNQSCRNHICPPLSREFVMIKPGRRMFYSWGIYGGGSRDTNFSLYTSMFRAPCFGGEHQLLVFLPT
jgi:hypothetical protein